MENGEENDGGIQTLSASQKEEILKSMNISYDSKPKQNYNRGR